MNVRYTGVVTEMRVLLIGTKPETAETVSLSLRLRWPDANLLVATDAENGLVLLEQESPDMVLLESRYSGAPLSRVIREIRSFSNVSLVVLAADGDETQEIMALESGPMTMYDPPTALVDCLPAWWLYIEDVRVSGFLT